jgi:hypothetical protein
MTFDLATIEQNPGIEIIPVNGRNGDGSKLKPINSTIFEGMNIHN